MANGDQKWFHTSRQLSHNTVAQDVGSVDMVGYKAGKSSSRIHNL